MIFLRRLREMSRERVPVVHVESGEVHVAVACDATSPPCRHPVRLIGLDALK
jgi:hypothetical protein